MWLKMQNYIDARKKVFVIYLSLLRLLVLFVVTIIVVMLNLGQDRASSSLSSVVLFGDVISNRTCSSDLHSVQSSYRNDNTHNAIASAIWAVVEAV